MYLVSCLGGLLDLCLDLLLLPLQLRPVPLHVAVHPPQLAIVLPKLL